MAEINGINGEEEKVITRVQLWMDEGKKVCRVEGLLKELEYKVNFASTTLAKLQAFRKKMVEVLEEDAKGYKCDLTSHNNAILSPQAKMSLYIKKMSGVLNEDIDVICKEVDTFKFANVKSKEGLSRYEFIKAMDELKMQARKFASNLNRDYTIDDSTETTKGKEEKKYTMRHEREVKSLKAMVKKLLDEKETLKQQNQTLNDENQSLIGMHTNTITLIDDLNASFNNKSTDLEAMRIRVFGAFTPQNSPIHYLVQNVPESIQRIIAPKGAVTADEFGYMIGSLVAITSYVVTHANYEIKITAPSAFITLISVMMGTMANNMVVHLSTARVGDAGLRQTLAKAMTSIPWIVFGGMLPLLVGGFITDWDIRAIVTGVVMFFVKIVLATMWVWSYDIPRMRAFMLVSIGVVGIAISAAVPSLIGWLVKIMKGEVKINVKGKVMKMLGKVMEMVGKKAVTNV